MSYVSVYDSGILRVQRSRVIKLHDQKSRIMSGKALPEKLLERDFAGTSPCIGARLSATFPSPWPIKVLNLLSLR